MKPLDRLRQEYKLVCKAEDWSENKRELNNDYLAMRLFCLDCELVSFNDIELMEYEVNSSFS
jgi:hypothetical protein